VTEHLPRHRLEALVMSGSNGDAASEAHVRSCAYCSARAQRMRAATQAFSNVSQPPAVFVRQVMEKEARSEPCSRMRKARWQPLAIAAAVFAGVLVWQSLPARDLNDSIRFKGTDQLTIYTKRGDGSQRLRDGASLRAGDQLGFTCSLAERKHLLLMSIDDDGRVSRYFPSTAGAAQVGPGANVQLPIAIELDAYRGRERIVGLFSSAPLDEGAARRALAAELAHARAQGEGVAGMKALEIDAEQVSLWFSKP
jgi:hypothetical protein